MSRLTLEQVKFNLGKIPGWKLDDQQMALSRTFVCEDFRSVIRLINQVAEYLEQDYQHLEMRIVGHSITFTLSTKEAKGLTGKDFALAQLVNKLTQSA
ncbi:4a-hydroxytetrahydrobiopterin dehydratase [Brevibacillus sp. SYP-B805]|uniref:4a-hydroxytetrahydrobiopterin dehydratase n=1 Tax=Brevibacillus sp. SYP-B805 TaxID=1578199 RepID=UPI0013EC2C8D|nr:4a-hydroxytetrahydrobiopterin dehydratase [Brevibacillus sp. SYP-B805]NGQ97113.1 4a-hydroxytetrahydrobiopterin dehydratase [Brevibacillus sp. SYP-B805]